MEILTYSSTSCFKNCRKNYKLGYIDQLIPKESQLFFTVGGAVHTALENWYKGNDKQTCFDAMNSYMYEFEPNIDDVENKIKFEEALILVENMFNNYIEHYKSEPFEVIEVEKEFSVPIINPKTNRSSRNYNLMGKVDGLVKEGGKLWLIEHKTASSINNQYLKGLTMNNQSICYIEALSRYMNIKIEGVIFNVLLKNFPKHPQELKKGGLSISKNQKTTPELFIESINKLGLNENDYADYIDYLKSNRKQYFYREYLVFNEKHIQEWKNELWDLQRDISEAVNKDRFYKNSSQCVSVYGSCKFFDICSSLDEGYIIDNMFKKKSSQHSEIVEEFKPF